MVDNQNYSERRNATPVASVLFGKVDISEKKTVCLVSGGNVDVTTLSRVITKGLSKSGRIMEIATKVVDQPGKLLELLGIISDTGANVMTISHDREGRNSDIHVCLVSLVLETRDHRHIEEIRTALAQHGYELLD